ncbi:MAG TPA: hypothetical protein VMS60_12845 [Solirubrobacterales bacterium]|nr:hypothetical protein [Solirubrobacterales bacterium]
MLERWRFAIDAAVAAVVALAGSGAVATGSIGVVAAAAVACFLAVVAGAVCASSYRRAFARACLASFVAIFAVLGFSPAELTDDWFHGEEGLSVSSVEILPFLVAVTLIPATLSALVAHALSFTYVQKGKESDQSLQQASGNDPRGPIPRRGL